MLQVRPWVRYWARMFDLMLFGLLVGSLVKVLVPEVLSAERSDTIFSLAIPFLWVFIESLLLSSFGTTPGKSLFRVTLALPPGSSMTLQQALSRSFKVWVRGLGFGLPIVNVVTLVFAHHRLKKNSQTSWDLEGGFTIAHSRIGFFRILIAVVFFIVVFGFLGFGIYRKGTLSF